MTMKFLCIQKQKLRKYLESNLKILIFLIYNTRPFSEIFLKSQKVIKKRVPFYDTQFWELKHRPGDTII